MEALHPLVRATKLQVSADLEGFRVDRILEVATATEAVRVEMGNMAMMRMVMVAHLIITGNLMAKSRLQE